MDDETPPNKPLTLAEGLPGRVMRLEMPSQTSEEMHAQADRLYEMSPFRNMTPEEEARARRMGPEMVERIKEVRERREREIKARREASGG